MPWWRRHWDCQNSDQYADKEQAMTVEIKVPGFPESVTDGVVTEWHKQPGDPVTQDEVLVDIETDKVVFEVPAPSDGVLEAIVEQAGATVTPQQILGRIDETRRADTASEAVVENTVVSPGAPAAVSNDTLLMAPAAEKLVREHRLEAGMITATGKGGRILKEDVLRHMEQQAPAPSPAATAPASRAPGDRPEKRVPMTRLRARVAERLVEAQHTAAILTTFNEANMQSVIDLRARYKDRFEKEHGVRLGFMSFFVKAAVEALKQFPEVNASIDATDIVYHGFFDIGIAVGSPRGLVVPILRDCDQLGMMDIEAQIRRYAEQAQKGTIAIEDITGGTFTITNGGVYGSMLSTPILNPPQSAILGMHKIQERPVVENGEIVIRPMMYLALSYDHRIIDGNGAVRFLVEIKDCIEDPARMLLDI